MDGGTLYHLRNVINRQNVKSDPTGAVTACEDFFVLVVEAHILSAAMTVFGMATVKDEPEKTFFPEGASKLDTLARRNITILAVNEVLAKFADFSYGEKEEEEGENSTIHDGVHAYACNLLSSGLLLMEFIDAVREGDGNRIIRCWRYFLLHFKVSNRTNYSIEAFTVLAQQYFFLSPRMAMQLTWNRTVNIHGRAGKNVSCDLHMEHLNKQAKQGIAGLGSNITDESVKRIGRSIGHTITVVENFDKMTDIKEPSGHRSRRSCDRDMKILLEQLMVKDRVFNTVAGRKHINYPNMSASSTRKIAVPDLKVWMKEQLVKLLTYR